MIKLNNCAFFIIKIDYLDHIIRPGRLTVTRRTTDVIDELKKPSTQTRLLSFFG